MDIKEYTELSKACGHGKIESLTPAQIDMIMNKDSHLYYVQRCEKYIREKNQLTQQEEKDLDVMIYHKGDKNLNENPESLEVKNQGSKGNDLTAIKIQIQQEIKLPDSGQINSTSNQLKKEDIRVVDGDDESKKEDNSAEKSSNSYRYGDFKSLKTERIADRQDHVQLAKEALFLPHYQDSRQKTDLEGDKAPYRLFFGPGNYFMFIKLFFAIYERILKAKDLIAEKIQQDLSEMNHADKV